MPSPAIVVAAGAGAAVFTCAAVLSLYRFLRRRLMRARGSLPIQDPPVDEEVSVKGGSPSLEITVPPTAESLSAAEKRLSHPKLRPLALPLKVAQDQLPPKKGLLPAIIVSKKRYPRKHIRSASMPSLSRTPTLSFGEEEKRHTMHGTPCLTKTADIEDDIAGRCCDNSTADRADINHQPAGDSNETDHPFNDRNEAFPSTSRVDNICASLDTSLKNEEDIQDQSDAVEIKMGEEHIHERAELEYLDALNDCELGRSTALAPLTDDFEADEEEDAPVDEADKPEVLNSSTPTRPSREMVPDLSDIFDLAVEFWPPVEPDVLSSPKFEEDSESDSETVRDCSVLFEGKDLDEKANGASFFSWVPEEVTLPPLVTDIPGPFNEELPSLEQLNVYEPASKASKATKAKANKKSKRNSATRSLLEVAKRTRSPFGVITNALGLVTARKGRKSKPSPTPTPTSLPDDEPETDSDDEEEVPEKNPFWRPWGEYKVVVNLKKPLHRRESSPDEEDDLSVPPFVMTANIQNTYDDFREAVEKHLGFPIILRGRMKIGLPMLFYITMDHDGYFRTWLKDLGYGIPMLDAWRTTAE